MAESVVTPAGCRAIGEYSAGMIERGWLPDYFPKSATNIREGHNIDTNRVWASFNYNVKDIKHIETVCTKVAESADGNKFLCPPYEIKTNTMILRNDGSGHFLSYEDGI